MGVDIGAISGFVTQRDEIEWDTEYMKANFDLNKNLGGYLSHRTFKELINWFETDDFEEDYCDVVDELGLKYVSGYDEYYVFVDYKTIQNEFPDEKIKDISKLVEKYLKSKGVSNPEVFKEQTFAYYW